MGEVKMTLKVFTKDMDEINTIEEEGENALHRLAGLLINEKNDKKTTAVRGIIDSHTGQQVIRAKQIIYTTHIYLFEFKGAGIENLPRL